MRTALSKCLLKLETIDGIFIHKLNKIFFGKTKADSLVYTKQVNNFKKKYFKNGIWNFNGVKLPELKPELLNYLYNVYLDTLFVHCIYNDNYDARLIDKLDKILPEGAYGYKNEFIDVTVKKNDVVIDAGAWIGDFSAYASRKGAKVFAFEPSNENLVYLYQTKDLNSNIEIIEKGLSDNSGISYITVNSSVADRISSQSTNSEKITLTTIDNFVTEKKLEKIDFIKSDIEGFERKMLTGAKQTLKNFAPKLSICTYHYPDDPEVLTNIILDANPDYIIVQKRKKLYAQAKNKL
jgi:FkbM family methyltransferase